MAADIIGGDTFAKGDNLKILHRFSHLSHAFTSFI